jgi:hypothetical protein
MNRSPAFEPNPRELDRLVDGELSDTERLTLLQAIDAEPNGEGWKRCALAFLEAQCWRAAFQPLAQPEPKAQDKNLSQAQSTTKAQTFPAGPHRPSILLAAASVLLAFAGGWLLGEQGAFSRAPSPPVLVAQAPVPEPEPTPTPIEPDEESPTFLTEDIDIDIEIENDQDLTTSPPWRTVGYVQLPAENGQAQDFRVPVLAGPGLNEDWLRRQPPAVPEAIRAHWENQGYRVEQRRRLVSVEMEDGRYLSIPVDEVDLHFVGGISF